MKMNDDVRRDRVLELYAYDSETGVFTHRFNKGGTARAGSVAGATERSGHLKLKVDQKRYKAHRLAWLIVHGRWPNGLIDHINRDPGDNRICNLRETDVSGNMHNRTINANNTSGAKGVHYCKRDKRWIVQVRCNNKTSAKRFATCEEATAFAAMMRVELHGEFARHF